VEVPEMPVAVEEIHERFDPDLKKFIGGKVRDPTGEELEQRLSETVRGMLEGLPPAHRQALQMTEYEGLTQREATGRLGPSVSGAKSRVQRARTRLKTLLLDCCHFELDRRVQVVNYYDREPSS